MAAPTPAGQTGLCSLAIVRFGPPTWRHVAGVPAERRRLADRAGPVWARHLGTAAGSSTAPGADLTRWAWFAAWPPDATIEGILSERGARGPMGPNTQHEAATIVLQPLAARGSWGGDRLSVPTAGPTPHPGEPIAVLTRARVRAARWPAFHAASKAVAPSVLAAEGRLLSLGVGEWPIGVQGTFSAWRTAAAVEAFARDERHRAAMAGAGDGGWYAEELFARFRVVAAAGSLDGVDAHDVLGLGVAP